MNDAPAVRLWLGWRAGHLSGTGEGWNGFREHLAQTFVPATWEVMQRFGLETYVPSVFEPSGAHGLPEEVALLRYASRRAYNSSKSTVAGRGYAVMHRAIFDFDTLGRKSKSGWADESAGDDAPALRQAALGAVSFGDADVVVHVLLLSTPDRTASSQAVMRALTGQPGSVAAWCQPGFAVVWLAASGVQDEPALSRTLLDEVPGSRLAAFHVAVDAPPIDQANGVPLSRQQTMLFRV